MAQQFAFGIGAFWAIRTDIATVGPIQFAVLQDNSIDFGFEVKELYSQLGFPVDIARGKGKVTGKTRTARIFGGLYAEIFFGVDPITTGGSEVAENEAGLVPSVSTYTVTVTNAANFLTDLGVYYGAGANAGNRFTRVTTPTLAGQYSVNQGTGIYTFSSLDAGAHVFISYVWNASTGFSFTITNQFMGYTPTFQGTFYTERQTLNSGGRLVLVLNQCTSSRLSFPSKIDEYNLPELDYMAFADNANIVGTLSTSQ
jgi:hypothetical protein